VLQCVAVCCSVLQCVAVCCSVLQCVALCCSVLQWLVNSVPYYCSQRQPYHANILPHTDSHSNIAISFANSHSFFPTLPCLLLLPLSSSLSMSLANSKTHYCYPFCTLGPYLSPLHERHTVDVERIFKKDRDRVYNVSR